MNHNSDSPPDSRASTAATAADRWTHFYDDKKSVSQLDYVLVAKSLRPRIEQAVIFRGGLSKKCIQYKGPRVGTISTASDHCALSVDLDL